MVLEETLKEATCVVQSHTMMYDLSSGQESGAGWMLFEGAVEETGARCKDRDQASNRLLRKPVRRRRLR